MTEWVNQKLLDFLKDKRKYLLKEIAHFLWVVV